MKEIRKIESQRLSSGRSVYIEFSDSYLLINSNKEIKSGLLKTELYENLFKGFSHYTKQELCDFQAIILKAFVKSHIELDDAVQQEKSIEEISALKESSLALKENLINITIYIEDTYQRNIKALSGI